MSVKDYASMPWDVVIAGSGGAGLRAAIAAAQAGARTLVVCKGRANRSGCTLLAGANISADIACDGATLDRLGISHALKDDTPDTWFEDVWREGFYLNNQKLLTLFTQTAGDRVEELVNWGMKVYGMEGEREISVQGSEILDVLYRVCKESGVAFVENAGIVDVETVDGRACGIVVADYLTGELANIPAAAVVLATGGAHNMFRTTSGPTDLAGEGQAAALRAGCDAVDLEFVSFCPTVISYPTKHRGNILPYILITTGYGELYNKYGKPLNNLSEKARNLALYSEWNKLLLSYSIDLEVRSGRAARHGGVYFAVPTFPVQIHDEMYADLPPLARGAYADIMGGLDRGEAVEVRPAAHYFEGGVRVDEAMRTRVPGLFAAGECTGGLFGANRVSSAVTEMLVEGAVAGLSAAAWAREQGTAAGLTAGGGEGRGARLAAVESDVAARLARGATPETVGRLTRRLQDAVEAGLGVIRDEEGLRSVLATTDDVEAELAEVGFASPQRAYNRELLGYLELRAMLPVARATARAALARDESRGVFIRQDRPWTDDLTQLSNVVVDAAGAVGRVPVEGDRCLPEPGRRGYIEYLESTIDEVD